MAHKSLPELALGNIYVRPNHLAKVGDRLAGHRHNFDHVTLVTQGAIHIDATLPDGTTRQLDLDAGGFCVIKAEVLHAITATAAHTEFLCIYAHRDPQGRVVQEFTGWEEAYQ